MYKVFFNLLDDTNWIYFTDSLKVSFPHIKNEEYTVSPFTLLILQLRKQNSSEGGIEKQHAEK